MSIKLTKFCNTWFAIESVLVESDNEEDAKVIGKSQINVGLARLERDKIRGL
jgi:hypothetical protein